MHIFPKYKIINSEFYCENLEKIIIFDKNSQENENPVVSLLYENDNLLKHVLKLF